MDCKELMDNITTEDVIEILYEMGTDYKGNPDNKSIQFQCVCHGDESYKLWYYTEDKMFYCYKDCGSMSLFDLLMKFYSFDFGRAFSFLLKFKGIKTNFQKPKSFTKTIDKCSDWDIINVYRKHKSKTKQIANIPFIDENIMKCFDNLYPSSWENDYITPQAMHKFGIKFYTMGWKAVIPHYDINGNLLGIRGRSFLESDIKAKRKYMPIYYGKEIYAHPLLYNLYGAYQNKDYILEKKKVILFESEKAVMQCETYYPDKNFSLAICGSNMSNFQRDMILKMGVSEVTIALDKQFKAELKNEEDKEEYEKYIRKVKNIANKLYQYINVYIIYCDDDRLGYKDAPSDCGKETLESLMREKIKYTEEMRRDEDEI